MKMKKYFMIFAAAFMTLAACQDEMTPEINTNENGIYNYPIEMTFVASNEAGTKTVINGESVTWESDDEIKVLWSNTGSNKAIAEPYNENSCAQFTTKVEEAEAYYAVHPYAATSSYVDGNIVVKVPAVQGGAFENANIAVAKANEDKAFLFRHLVGMIEFTTDTPGKVTISGAEGDVLTGTVTVTGFDENGYPQYSEDNVTDASSVIEIDVKASGTYYAAFLPSTTLKCLSVKVEGSESTEYALSANQVKMARGKVIELGNIDTRFGKNIFVSAAADGKGDGKTWETALTYQQMANMIAAVSTEGPNAPSGDTNTALDNADSEYLAWHNGVRAAALNGITFHIAEGTYKTSNYVRVSFPGRKSAVKLSFKGGYSSESKGTDLSKRFATSEDVTIITGEKARRHFFVRYSSNVTFDGITFTEGYTTASGGSILFNESETSTLNIKNCKFISNEAEGTNGGAICGGGSAAIGKAVIVDCVFDANTSNAGGAIYANDGIWNLTNCTISNNGSAGAGGALYLSEDAQMSVSGGSLVSNVAVTNGGAAYASCKAFSADDVDFISNKGELTAANNSQGGAIYFASTSSGNERSLINCLFKENTVDAANATTDNYVRGGAIYIQSSSPNVVFTNCTFESNKQLNATSYKQHGGGAIYATKSFTARGCTFNTNDAYLGGAVATEDGVSTLISCVFSSNTSGNRGGAVYSKSRASMNFTECDFTSNVSSDNGGACWLTTTGKTTFSDCDFDGNKTEGQLGGAFYINSTGVVDIDGGIIENSYAGGDNGGGAFYISGAAQIDITDTEIRNNTAKNAGGAIWISAAAKLNVNGTAKFTGNKAGTYGGAIYVKESSAATISLNGTTFSDNESENNGGALHIQTTSSFQINNCYFQGNSVTGNNVGGAIYSNSSVTSNVISQTKFIENSAGSNGGAVNGSGKINLNKSVFSGNAAKYGAALNTSNTIYCNACSFTDNAASNNGTGGVYYASSGTKAYINNSSFHNNDGSKVTTNMSDIVVNGANLLLMNSTIYEDEINVIGMRAYNTTTSGQVCLYNNVILTNYHHVQAGWGTLSGYITSGGYNYTGAWGTEGTGSVLKAELIDSDKNKKDYPTSFTEASTTDGRGYYTWTKPTEVAGTTAANVTSFLDGITGGSDFATWLGTVDGLTKDIAGNNRPETGWYPGCYQGK